MLAASSGHVRSIRRQIRLLHRLENLDAGILRKTMGHEATSRHITWEVVICWLDNVFARYFVVGDVTGISDRSADTTSVPVSINGLDA